MATVINPVAQVACAVNGVTREPGSRGRKSTPKRASESVDESVLPSKKAPRKRQEKLAHLAPPLPDTVKRVRQASTKYDGDFAVAIPTKGSRGCMKDDEYYATNTTRDEYYEYYVGDEPLVAKYYRTDEPLQYARVKSVRKEADESPSTSAGADGVPRPPDDGSPQLWAEIGDYVDDVAKSGTLSQSEMARLRRLARQQSEPLRRVYAVWKHSHSRFVNNVMGLLKQAAAEDENNDKVHLKNPLKPVERKVVVAQVVAAVEEDWLPANEKHESE